MICYDYKCKECGHIQEEFFNIKDKPEIVSCETCGGYSSQIITMRDTSPIDCSWIGDVLAVVDKTGKKQHCNEFLKHPTRNNYKSWMKGEGLRPLEDNEPMFPKEDKTAELARREKVLTECVKRSEAISI